MKNIQGYNGDVIQEEFFEEQVEIDDDEEEKRAFMTDVDIRLAKHEIDDPSGQHNTDLEQALAAYERVSEDLKRTQHEYH